jgi:hypothetical protein
MPLFLLHNISGLHITTTITTTTTTTITAKTTSITTNDTNILLLLLLLLILIVEYTTYYVSTGYVMLTFVQNKNKISRRRYDYDRLPTKNIDSSNVDTVITTQSTLQSERTGVQFSAGADFFFSKLLKLGREPNLTLI